MLFIPGTQHLCTALAVALLVGSCLFFCSAFHACVTLCAFLVSEEPSEDVEGPSETAGDAEEPPKEQESGGDKDQSKWTGMILGFSRGDVWSLTFFKSRRRRWKNQWSTKPFLADHNVAVSA